VDACDEQVGAFVAAAFVLFVVASWRWTTAVAVVTTIATVGRGAAGA
jgi:uncharacterized membrane protein